MIIVNRIAELIIKYRNSDLSKAERDELREWLAQRDEHFLLFRDLTDDDYLFAECTRMLEGDKKASWKKIEQKLFKTLSDAPAFDVIPVSLPVQSGGPPPASKRKHSNAHNRPKLNS